MLRSVEGRLSLRHLTTTLAAELRPLLATSRWAARVTWESSRSMSIGLLANVVVRGLMPAGLAITARGLINAAVAATRAGGNVGMLIPWLIAGFSMALIEALTPLTNRFCLQRLSDEVNLKVTADVLEHATQLDVGSIEDPRLRDMLDRAQQSTGGVLARFIGDLQGTCTDVVQVIFILAVLMYVEPLVLIIVGPFALPYLFFRWRNAKRRYHEEHALTTRRRWTRYFVSHLTGHRSAAEIKLLGLGPLFLEKFRAIAKQFRDVDAAHYRRDLTASSIFAVLTTVVFYLLFARVAWRAVHGGVTVGDIAIFAGMSSRLRATLERVIFSISSALSSHCTSPTCKCFWRPNRASSTPVWRSRNHAVARSSCVTSRSDIRAPRSACSPMSRCTSRRARWWRSSVRTAPARPRS